MQYTSLIAHDIQSTSLLCLSEVQDIHKHQTELRYDVLCGIYNGSPVVNFIKMLFHVRECLKERRSIESCQKSMFLRFCYHKKQK